MLVILFRSKLTSSIDGYEELAEEMVELGKAMPGFVEFKSFKAEDGERLSVAWWKDQETLAAWRTNTRHQFAQQMGRERFYEYFNIEVAEIVRSKQFRRGDS
ncbi:MAG: antibiotic biosynthesis monooxygenase family protein [Terriglobales bacterium]|jgi:heme-degrading monooxygenase HmoA